MNTSIHTYIQSLYLKKNFFFTENQEGVHKSNIVEWYLNLIADQIESEDELLAKKELIEKVIERLIYTVSFLNMN